MGLLWFLLASFCTLAVSNVRYDGYKVLRVIPNSEVQLNFLRDAITRENVDVWKEPHTVSHPVDFMVSPEEVGAWVSTLSNARMDVNFYVDDVQSLIDRSMTKGHLKQDMHLDTGRYYELEEIWAFMDDKVEQCGDFCDIEVIGESWNRKELKLIRIRSPLDDGEENPDRPAIWIDGGIHAREWISPAVVMYFIERLVTDYEVDPEVTELRDSFDWYIDPVVNPDGYEYTFEHDRMWRKTRSHHPGNQCFGTDGNRNFHYMWGEPGPSDDSCQQTYRGPEPQSEPEMQRLDEYMMDKAHRFELCYTIHSYGSFLIYPWGYTTDYDIPHEEHHITVIERHIDAINEVHDNEDVIDYYYIRSAGTMAGNTIDWCKGGHGIEYSYLMELPDFGQYGFILPPEHILEVDEEQWAGMKQLAFDVRDMPLPDP